MSAEGITYMKFDVPDDVAAHRGRIIVKLFDLRKFNNGLRLEGDDEEGERIALPNGETLTYAGVYRAIIQKIAEEPKDSHCIYCHADLHKHPGRFEGYCDSCEKLHTAI